MTIRKDIFQIGYSGEPNEYGLILLESINERVAKLNLPDKWIVRKAWKPYISQFLADGNFRINPKAG